MKMRFQQLSAGCGPPDPDNNRPDMPLGHVLTRSTGSADGFTLIELVVVIALIGIVLMVAVPRLQGDFFSHKTKKASRWLLINIPALKHKAIREKKIYTLRLDLDENKVWSVGDATAAASDEEGEKGSEEELQETADEAAREKSFNFPEGVDIVDVEYPDTDKISSGEAEIIFYPAGYSDKAIIHVEDDDDNRLSFLIEPFLTKVKMVEDYVEFE